MDLRTTIIKTLLGESVKLQESNDASPGYQMKNGRHIPLPSKTMTPREHGKDYAAQTIEDAKSKAHVISLHREILKDNPHPKNSKEHKEWEAGTHEAKDEELASR
jgi:hypothetical protein